MDTQLVRKVPPATYDGLDPVSGPITGDYQMVEEGYISERGSVFDMIDDNTVEFDMAHRLIGRVVARSF